MTDAILRDEPASPYQNSSSGTFLDRCRDVVARIRAACTRKEEFQGIPLDTPLPKISAELVDRIVKLRKFNENLLEGPSYKAKLAHDLDNDLKSAIGEELLAEYERLKGVESEAEPSESRLLGHFRTAAHCVREELVNAFDAVKVRNRTLGWALNDVIHSAAQTPEERVQRLAVDFSLMEAHCTAARCFNHWRNAGAEYIQARSEAAGRGASAPAGRAPA